MADRSDCVECGAEVSRTAKFCRACGSELSASPVSPPEPEQATCAQCGVENNTTAKYCRGCGTALNDPVHPRSPVASGGKVESSLVPGTTTSPAKASRRRALLLRGGGLMGAIGAVITIVVLIALDDDGDPAFTAQLPTASAEAQLPQPDGESQEDGPTPSVGDPSSAAPEPGQAEPDTSRSARAAEIARRSTVRIGVRDTDRSPIVFNAPDYDGFEPALAREIVRRLFGNIDIAWVPVTSFNRFDVLDDLDFVVASTARTPVREDLASWTGPYLFDGPAVGVRKGTATAVGELNGLRIGFTSAASSIKSKLDGQRRRIRAARSRSGTRQPRPYGPSWRCRWLGDHLDDRRSGTRT